MSCCRGLLVLEVRPDQLLSDTKTTTGDEDVLILVRFFVRDPGRNDRSETDGWCGVGSEPNAHGNIRLYPGTTTITPPGKHLDQVLLDFGARSILLAPLAHSTRWYPSLSQSYHLDHAILWLLYTRTFCVVEYSVKMKSFMLLKDNSYSHAHASSTGVFISFQHFWYF